MKTLLISVFLLPLILSAQTEEFEKESMMNRFNNGEIDAQELSKLRSSWTELLSDFGGYPNLPYNPSKQEFDFTTIFEFEGLSKKLIYDRILEWTAISFGSISEVLHYSDLSSGKIIVKGSFEFYFRDDDLFWGKKKEDIEEAKSFQTWVFTIVDNKLKIETFSIEYSTVYYVYSTSGTYNKMTERMPIKFLYPITSSDPLEWKGRLSILQRTSTEFANIHSSVKAYISNYYADYKF